MKEKFGAMVEEGTVARLRTLAGGERKIGEFLSGMIAWAWEQRDALEQTSWQELKLKDLNSMTELEKLKRRLDGIEEMLDILDIKVDVADKDNIV